MVGLFDRFDLKSIVGKKFIREFRIEMRSVHCRFSASASVGFTAADDPTVSRFQSSRS